MVLMVRHAQLLRLACPLYARRLRSRIRQAVGWSLLGPDGVQIVRVGMILCSCNHMGTVQACTEVPRYLIPAYGCTAGSCHCNVD